MKYDELMGVLECCGHSPSKCSECSLCKDSGCRQALARAARYALEAKKETFDRLNAELKLLMAGLTKMGYNVSVNGNEAWIRPCGTTTVGYNITVNGNETRARPCGPTARWISDGGNKWHCSDCGYFHFVVGGKPFETCPKCLARMEVDDNDD